MTITPNTEETAVERVESIKLHLRYLHSVAARPETVDTEIARRRAAIAAHLEEIARLEQLKSTVLDVIKQKQALLQRLKADVIEKRLEAKTQRWRELRAQMARLAADIESQERELNNA